MRITMKKIITLMSLSLLLIMPLITSADPIAAKDCFLATQESKVIYQEGDSAARHAPCSTFKISLGLMGYDAKLLTDETHPEWPFQDHYDAFREEWRELQTLTSQSVKHTEFLRKY